MGRGRVRSALERGAFRVLHVRGGDTRFLIWVTFLVTFVWIRITTAYLEPAPSVGVPGQFQFGGRTILFGYHPHHIAIGILLLAIAGWIGLHSERKSLKALAAILYGSGLGLIVDEAALVVRGINQSNDILEVIVLVAIVGSLLMSTVYASSFWRSIHGSVERTWGKVWSSRKAEPPESGPLEPSSPSEDPPRT